MIKRLFETMERRHNLISHMVIESSVLLFLMSLALVVYVLSQSPY